MNKLEIIVLDSKSKTEKAIRDAYDMGRADAIESAYYVIKPFMSIEEWTEGVNRQIKLKE